VTRMNLELPSNTILKRKYLG